MLSLNINKLRSEVEDREKKKIKIFENILEMCYQKILNANKQYNDYSCTFVVPNFVFGLPLYDIGDCIKFIMDKLVEKGFEIYFALPSTIHISWKPEGYMKKMNTNYNTNNTIEYYNTLKSNNQLMIKYDGSNNLNNNTKNKKYTTENTNNMNSTKNNNDIKYRPINEYKTSMDTIYNLDDLDIFQNKVEHMF